MAAAVVVVVVVVLLLMMMTMMLWKQREGLRWCSLLRPSRRCSLQVCASLAPSSPMPCPQLPDPPPPPPVIAPHVSRCQPPRSPTHTHDRGTHSRGPTTTTKSGAADVGLAMAGWPAVLLIT